MKLFRDIAFTVACICLATSARADFSFNTDNTKAFEDILKLRLESGEQHLAHSKSMGINGLDIYMENYIEIIRLIAAEDLSLYKQYLRNERIRLRQIEEMDASSPYYLLTQSEIRLHWAMVHYKMGNFVEAFFRIRKAYKLIRENDDKFPNFLPNQKTLAFFKIIFSMIPEQYFGYLDIMGFDPGIADLSGGMQDLARIAKSDLPFAAEALLIKECIRSYILHDHASAHATLYQLYQDHPDNYAYYTGALLTAMNAHMGQKAILMLENLPNSYEFRKNTFYDFLKAKVNMQVGNYGRAIYYAKRYIERTSRANYIKESNLIIFFSYWFMDQDEIAMPYLDKVRKEGLASVSGDRYALEFAKLNTLPDKNLSLARFLSDAGEYDKALSILAKKTLSQYSRSEDQAEYCYRTARIMHQQGKYSQACLWYQKTIQVANDLPRYFAPKSALFLAEIYDKKLKDKPKAIHYYQKVLTYPKTEYKTELEMSAKAALQKLSSQ